MPQPSKAHRSKSRDSSQQRNDPASPFIQPGNKLEGRPKFNLQISKLGSDEYVDLNSPDSIRSKQSRLETSEVKKRVLKTEAYANANQTDIN